MSSGRRWALAGGGTGGHIVPGLHLLEALAARDVDLEHLLWFTSGRGVEEAVLAGLADHAQGAETRRVALPLEPPGGGAPGLMRVARRLLPATLAARRELREARSQLVLGLGGFTAAPAVLAARSLGVPAYLIEVNAVAGRATRFLAPLCRRVFHAFPSSTGSGARHRTVGPIVGPSFGKRSETAREELRKARGWSGDSKVLTVLGGSQGAAGLNRFLVDHGRGLFEEGIAVVHQVGPGRLDEAADAHLLYHAVEYVDDVAALLAGVDGVLCRGGASTLAEVAAVGVPAWVVPYPHHPDQHQRRNAQALGFVVLEESGLDRESARTLVEELGRSPGAVPTPILLGAEAVLDELL